MCACNAQNSGQEYRCHSCNAVKPYPTELSASGDQRYDGVDDISSHEVVQGTTHISTRHRNLYQHEESPLPPEKGWLLRGCSIWAVSISTFWFSFEELGLFLGPGGALVSLLECDRRNLF